MKKWLKILLGVAAVLLLGVGFVVIRNWGSISILMGTGNLSQKPQAIPDVVETIPELRAKGEADWPSWRGAQGDGRSLVTGIITDWSSGLNQVWEVDFLCRGQASATWAAPVIQGDRLIVCGRDETHDLVFCLHTTDGSLLWEGAYPAEAAGTHGAGMRATPTIDDDRVYTFGRSGDLVCWNLINGKLLWRKNVDDEGGEAPKWGHSSSPLVTQELVLVQGGGAVRVIAFEKMTGEVKWTSGHGDAGYAALVTATPNDIPMLLAFHGHGLAAIAPDTGVEMWNIVWETPYGVNAATPIVSGDKVFMTSGYDTGCQLLQISRSETKVLWTNKAIASHHSDAYILDGFIYGYSGLSLQNKGFFKCVELANGTEKWSTGEMGWGTCVYVNGYLLCLDIKGNLFLMKPDPERFIKITAIPSALGDVKGPVWTHPVIANGKLYLRFKQRLVCYDLLEK